MLTPLFAYLLVCLASCINSFAESFEETKPKAEQGFAYAQFNLALMYDKGEGVPQDYKEAVKWYTKAAEQGDADAQTNLGVMYEYGLGVPKSYIKAYSWYNLASEDNAKARQSLNKLEDQMTPQQLTEAKELSKTLVKK